MAIFTGIGAAIFGAGTFLAGLTAAALQVAAGVGLSLIAKSLAGEPEGPKFGVQGRLQGGDDVPRSILLGYNCTAGSFVYANAWGSVSFLVLDTPNAFLTQVIALADYPIRELVAVEVNGAKATLIRNEPHPEYGFPVEEFRKGGVDHLWIKFYDGTQTSADPFLVNKVSSAERPYNGDRVGFGIPYVIATSMAPERKDGEESPLFNGFPTFKFVTNGARLYDISRDSTQGGSGTQRWNNPATWGGDGDFLPAVQIYNLLRGIRFGNKWLYGLQNLNGNRLPSANWITAINKCRAPIEGPNGMEPTYRTGGEIQVGAQVKVAIEAFLTGCEGRLTEIGGTYKLHVGMPNSPVMSFTDEDILSTEEQTFTPFFTLEDTINGIQATYPSPEEGWNTKTAPPLIRADLEALDGNRRLMADVGLEMVPYIGQVQRLMRSSLQSAQRARRHTIVLGPEYWALEPGDIIRWTSVRNGYINKLFRIDGISDRSNLDIMVDMTEVDPADYDWNQSVDYRPVIVNPIELVGYPALPMIGWQVYPVAIKDQNGANRRPAIEIVYQSGLQDIESVKFQVRPQGSTEIFLSGDVPYGDPWRTIIQADFPPNSTFEVRGIFVRYSNGTSVWSDWLSVTTLNIQIGPVDLTPELNDFFDDIDEFLEVSVPIINEKVDTVEQNLNQLISEVDTLETNVSDDIIALQNQLANDISELEATLGVLQTEVAAISGAPDFDLATTYDVGDLLKYEGKLYRAIALSTGNLPTNTNFFELIGEYSSLGEAVAALASDLTAEVSRINGILTSQATQINTVVSQIAGKADASAVTALTTRVTQAENTLSSVSGAITTIQSNIGTISAAGANLLVDTYSWLYSTTLPTTVASGLTVTGVVVANAPSGFGYRLSNTTTANTPFIVFAPTNNTAGWNIFLESGTYIVSFYAQSSIAAQTIQAGIWNGAATLGANFNVGTTRVRAKFEITIAASTKAGLIIYPNRNAVPVNTLLTIDSLMIERKAGTATSSNPSSFVPGPSAASSAANAVATTALETRVTSVEGVNTSQATAITNLTSSIAGKADASAVTALATRVTNAEGVNSSQATAITNLTSSLAGKADASAVVSLETRVTDIEDVNTSQATAITNLTSSLAGKADASALTSLTTRVTNAEGVNSSQATAITNLTSSLAGKADASAVTALETKVTQTDTTLSTISKDTRRLKNSLLLSAMNSVEGGSNDVVGLIEAKEASAIAIEEVRTEVTQVGNTVTAMAESLTQLEAEIGEGLAESIEVITTRVDEIDGELNATATAVNLLSAALGGNSSQILVKWETVAAPAGFSARYALRAAVTQDGILRQASLFLDVPANASQKTRIGFSADQTVFFDSNGNALALIGGDGVLRSSNNAFQANMLTGDVTMTQGSIRSADNKFLISPNQKRIFIST